MSDDLVLRPPAPVAPTASAAELLEVWRDSLSEETRRAYLQDLTNFASHVGAPSPREAVEGLLRGGKVPAEKVVLGYLRGLFDRGMSPATVARRRAALRSVVRLAEGLGLVQWALSAPLPRSGRPRSYRDTSGPGLVGVQQMRAVAVSEGGLKGLRDVGLLGMIFSLGLRRREVCQLCVSDYRASERKLSIIGKGHSEPELLSVPEQLAAELDAYLTARGHPTEGPLFASCDRAKKGTGRLSPSGLYRLIRQLAHKAGIQRTISPHRLRHASITQALDGTKGDVRRVRSFARHRKVETTLVYDDRRRDIGGEVATILAAALGSPTQQQDQEE